MAVQGTRTDALVDEFEAACSELRATIAGVSDGKWQVSTPGDGRQVNVVAHHAAGAHRAIADMLQAMANAQTPSIGMDQIHAGNAEHARQFAACTKVEVLEQHDQGAAYATTVLSGLNDEQLARRGEFLVGMPMTVEQAVQGVLIGHPREHTATIQGAVS
jgi:hypothetical protein